MIENKKNKTLIIKNQQSLKYQLIRFKVKIQQLLNLLPKTQVKTMWKLKLMIKVLVKLNLQKLNIFHYQKYNQLLDINHLLYIIIIFLKKLMINLLLKLYIQKYLNQALKNLIIQIK